MNRSFFKILFYFIFILLFVVPSKNITWINFFGIANLNIIQFVTLFLPVLYILSSRKYVPVPFRIKNIIILFSLYFLLLSVLKNVIINFKVIFIFFDYRLAMVFFAALLIIFSGNRLNSKHLIFIFLLSIFISYVWSLVFFFLRIPFISHGGLHGNSLLMTGRLINGNKDFSVLGLYVLFNLHELKKLIGKKVLKFVVITAITSLVIALLNFDRTLLTILIVESVLLFTYSKKHFIKKAFLFIVFTIFIFEIGIFVYKNNDIVRHQIDRRILSIVLSNNSFSSLENNTWKGNRDFMIEGAMNAFFKHPLIGTSFSAPLFYYPDGTPSMKTDVTVVNLLARYGIIGFILVVSFYAKLYFIIKSRSMRGYEGLEGYISSMLAFVLPLYFLYSLNHDAIFRGVVIIFIAFLFNSTNIIDRIYLKQVEITTQHRN